MLIDDFLARAPKANIGLASVDRKGGDLRLEPTISIPEVQRSQTAELKQFLIEALPQAAKYDVNNVWNEWMTSRREELFTLGHKAPLFPRQPLMWFEFKNSYVSSTQTGRVGFLVCEPDAVPIPTSGDYPHEVPNWVVLVRHKYDIVRMVEFQAGRQYDFIGHVWLDENYNALTIGLSPSVKTDEAKASMNDALRFLTTVIGLLNWDRTVVPTSVTDMAFTNWIRKKNGKHLLSSPTVIDITALKHVKPSNNETTKPGKSEGSEGSEHAGVCYHPVAGHLRRVSPLKPLFGKPPVAGKTCGVLRIRPHFRGNPEYGIKQQATYVLKASAASASASPKITTIDCFQGF